MHLINSFIKYIIMKIIIPLVLFFLLLFSTEDIQAQTSSLVTITLKVSGNCEMCKERIETAAKGRGVKEASWDADSKLLTLTYDTPVSYTHLDVYKRQPLS